MVLFCSKTCFSRGFIREKVCDNSTIVSSPSYLLKNSYECSDGSILHHIDLYRMKEGSDASIIGIPDIFSSGDDATLNTIVVPFKMLYSVFAGISLIEWANRLNALPSKYIRVSFEILPNQDRKLIFDTVGMPTFNGANMRGFRRS